MTLFDIRRLTRQNHARTADGSPSQLLPGQSSVGMNDRYTHGMMKPLQQAIAVLPSVNEEQDEAKQKDRPK